MNVPKNLDDAYINFFLKTEEGKYFTTALDEIIDNQHIQAEKDGETARDYTQRAKGARLVQEHIQSVVGGIKKP
jgi:hypothetical protein